MHVDVVPSAVETSVNSKEYLQFKSNENCHRIKCWTLLFFHCESYCQKGFFKLSITKAGI